MTRALLVDFGGVLTTSVLDAFAAFCVAEEIDIDVFRGVVMGASRTPDSPFARVEVGAITQEEFDVVLAAALSDACGKPVAADGLKQRLFAALQADDEMVAAVRAARRSGIRTALVSNSWGGRDYPREDFDDLFDVVIISGEVGLRKPEPQIFALAAREVGVEPAGCVFVDDFQVNVEGAEAVGMIGVHHRSAMETIPRLEALFERGLR